MIKNINRRARVNKIPDEFDLRKNIDALLDNKYIILIFTSILTVAGLFYSIITPPVYHADSLVQVEPAADNNIMGSFSPLMTADASISDTEMQLITSRRVLGKTAAELNLDTEIKFITYPVIGRVIHRFENMRTPELVVSEFEPMAGVTGDRFTIESLGGSQYKITTPSGTVAQGMVGHTLTLPEVVLLVTSMQAEKGDAFSMTKLDSQSVVSDLQKEVQVIDQGKNTGILTISYNGNDPKKIRKIVQKISDNYVSQSIERKSEEAQKSLDFLRNQLPVVRGNLDDAEQKLNKFRRENNSVDLPMEAKATLDSQVLLDAKISELTFKEAEISQRYTKQHPVYVALLEKRHWLEDEKKSLILKIDKLPQTQQEIVKLTRDVQSDQEIYMQLLDKEQELNVRKASTLGNVRIIDSAITQLKPVKPKKTLITLISACLGLIFSSGIVLAKTALIRGINSTDMLEETGLDVLASVPHSVWQRENDRQALNNSSKGCLLAVINPTDTAIEALRSLRTSLYFLMLEAQSNVLMISGASIHVGKTFISSNLAAIIAQAENKVLYIDADMRKGYAHTLLGCDNNGGLSEVLTGQIAFSNAVKSTNVPGLDMIPRGEIPKNPSELLLRKKCEELITWASSQYDVVIIDVPPILAVTDAAIIGKCSGVCLLVAKFEQSTLLDIESSIRIFEQNNVNIRGAVLNSVKNRASSYYGYRQYE